MSCRLIFVASAVLSLATKGRLHLSSFSVVRTSVTSRVPVRRRLLCQPFPGRRSWKFHFAGRRSLLLIVARVRCQLQRDRRSCAGIESVTAGADGAALVPSADVHRSGTKVLWVHWWREFLREFPGISRC